MQLSSAPRLLERASSSLYRLGAVREGGLMAET